VYHFVAHMDRRPEKLDGTLHDFYGPIHPGTESAWIC
jgi:hypothetical protein